MADEKQWLQNKIDELRKYVGLIVEEYDEARLTKAEAMARIGIMCKDSLTTTYDHAFTEGINAADLDGDSEEEVDVDFEFEEGEEDEGEEDA